MTIRAKQRRGVGRLVLFLLTSILVTVAFAAGGIFLLSDEPRRLGFSAPPLEQKAISANFEERELSQVDRAALLDYLQAEIGSILSAAETNGGNLSAAAQAEYVQMVQFLVQLLDTPKTNSTAYGAAGGGGGGPLSETVSAAKDPDSLLYVTVSYPNRVDIGDSIKITVSLVSEMLETVYKDGVAVNVNGPLEWGNQSGTRMIEAGRKLPLEILFTPIAKDTGAARIVINARATSPLAIYTAAGSLETHSDEASAAASAKTDGNSSLTQSHAGANAMAAAGEAPAATGETSFASKLAALPLKRDLEVETDFEVTVLSKYHLPDLWVHWGGILGWIVSAIGLAAMGKLATDLWTRLRMPTTSDAPPQMPHT